MKSKYYQDEKSAGPQSKILDGISQEEARKLMEEGRATMSGDHVVMVGAASKGIIQREHQHNAVVYHDVFSPNPFDRVTDEDLESYRKTIERKEKGEDETDEKEEGAKAEGTPGVSVEISELMASD